MANTAVAKQDSMIRPKPRRRSSGWIRQNLTLNMIISLTAACAILGANSAVGYYALSIIYKNKLVDTWAIMFLELEREGNQLSARLRGVLRPHSEAAQRPPSATLQVGEAGRLTTLRGALPPNLQLRDFGLDAASPATRDWPQFSVLDLSGERFIASWAAEAEGPRLLLWSLPANFFASLLGKRGNTEAMVYMLTRQGRLLGSNVPEIKGLEVMTRPLVQRFIAAPVAEGQLEYQDGQGNSIYGFFYEIPQSNIVIFSEVEKSHALSALTSIVAKALGALAIILLISLLLLQYPLSKITAPLRELAALTRQIGSGNFVVAIKAYGFGELRTLTTAFDTMSRNLIAREKAIILLLEEQTQKVRLEAELGIASAIQSNLLSFDALPKGCGVDIATAYFPAGQCAGDWYGYFHQAERQETVVAIADVSGHGAGSAMFTSMIACLFDEHHNCEQEPFSPLAFAEAVDGAIARLGKLRWHATMLVLRYLHAEAELEILFAGHTNPLINYPASSNLPNKTLIQPSSPAGIGFGEFKPKSVRVPFPKGSSICIYTDGLTEASNPVRQAFGSRRVKKAFAATESLTAAHCVETVLTDWNAFRGATPAQDDTCIIVMRAV